MGDLRIKTAFVSQTLSETAAAIREGQNRVVDEWNLFVSGELKASIQGHFSVDSAEEKGKLSMSYLKYARFLDMPGAKRTIKLKKREGYRLYNRLVFGILYNKTLNELRYGLTDDVKAQIDLAINKAMRQSMSEA